MIFGGLGAFFLVTTLSVSIGFSINPKISITLFLVESITSIVSIFFGVPFFEEQLNKVVPIIIMAAKKNDL